MPPPREEQIRQALAGVIEPESGENIVARGMVSDLVVKDGNIGFAIEVEPEKGGAEAMEILRQKAEKVVFDLPGVTSVTAVLTAERQAPGQSASAPSSAPPSAPAGRPGTGPAGAGAPAPQSGIPGIRFIIAVASGKGGVGKSTTATNLALALDQQGHSVGLLDADIYGPSQPRMLGISGRPASPDGRTLTPMENYGVKCMSMGFLVAEDTPMIWRGPMVQSALQQMLRDVAWGEIDVLVVDMPPGTGDAQLTMAQQVPLSGAVIVSTPQDIALLDARKGLNMFRKVDVPVLGIIENMSLFVCPECGHESHIFSHGGARKVAGELGMEFLGEMPLDIAIRTTSDDGRPIVASHPDGPVAATYRAIAEKVWAALAGGEGAGKAAPKIVMQ
jgi:ATP-binding protein involved in chromosome partitioning